MENFHSIIHRGLLCALNERSAYGPGSYLTLKFGTARGFSNKSDLWKHSKLSPTSTGLKATVECIAIVEVVDDPSIHWPQITNPAESKDDLWLKRKNCYCCVVNSDHLMQLSHLIVLCNDKSAEFRFRM